MKTCKGASMEPTMNGYTYCEGKELNVGPNMATLESRSSSLDDLHEKTKSPQVTGQKVRELLNEGMAFEDVTRNQVDQDQAAAAPNGTSQGPSEAVSKEGFFSRVESYTCLKWAGKPSALSPLMCARYGWINVDCDMLKCSSCQAFLCVSLQPTRDVQKYEESLSELTKLLQAQHEKFCFWPDCPCPDRFWRVPISEPEVLLSSFLERYRSTCLLELQLPAMKPEDLKAMSLTEEAIGVLLQLVEDEQQKGDSPLVQLSAEPLSVQVAACIVALCGWAASPSLSSLHLPILTCSCCLRKVGLWSFHQIEGMIADTDSSFESPTTPVSGQEVRGDRLTPTSPTCRMKLRSQDTMRTHEQVESSPSPVMGRMRSRDTPSPSEELPSPMVRGKRPVTRSRGQGDTAGQEVPSSPQRKAKRLRLSSSSSSETSMHRGVFDPIAQHRDWCPWVTTVDGDAHKELQLDEPQSSRLDLERPIQGWREALQLFLSLKRPISPAGPSSSQGLHDKSKGVFKIFHQWQLSSSTQ